METRQITQVRIYKLWMYDMRQTMPMPRIVAISYEKQKLKDWYQEMIAEEAYLEEKPAPVYESTPTAEGLSIHKDPLPATQDQEKVYYTKAFRKDTVLEWYNLPKSMEEIKTTGDGINDDWTTQENIDGFLKSQAGKTIMVE